MKTKTTDRFDRAVTKLYNAFHGGTLNAFDCKACAVGNMCGGYGGWNRCRTGLIGAPLEDPRAVYLTEYSPKELGRIEKLFMDKFANERQSRNKHKQFKALCAVVEYLCELDGIPNVMDYTKLFEYDKELNPIHEL